MTQEMTANFQLQDKITGFQPAHAVDNARELAVISFISPILYMVGLVSSAVLLMSDLGQTSDVFRFWLIAQCLACAFLFLDSLRDKAILLDRDLIATSSLLKQFSFVAVGVCWGVVPSALALVTSAEMHLVFGAILSGLTLSATLLLICMPKVGKLLLAITVGGFLANTLFQPDLFSQIMSLTMLVYFGVLGMCSRWYYARFNQRLEASEEVEVRTQELKSVLKDIGQAADTYFWRTDQHGILTEISNGSSLVNVMDRQIVGQQMCDLFAPSSDRDLLVSRFARQSEVVALEVEVETPDHLDSRWWKMSARPVFEDRVFCGYRGAASDITALRASEKRAAFLTEFDSLTGLLNRPSFYNAVQIQLGQSVTEEDECGILWIDLDNFKWINDTFGHAGGDEILQLVAKRLEASCDGSKDVICRFGGDEFAVLATRPRAGDQLRQFVEQLTQGLAAPYTLESSEVQCSASIGFRRIDDAELDASSLMKEADLALYSAKSGGRATWKEYSEAFKAKVRGQRDLAQDLEKAIGTDEFQLDFQPIVDGRTKRVVAVEALSRWIHPTRGAISPAEFIAVAEHNGMIIRLGDTVVAKAIDAVVHLPEEVRVGINISPLQIHSSALLTLIENKLEETGVTPGRIELEITESVFLSDNAFVLDRLKRLKDLGVRIVLDDFGTGFSSLAYLQRFPFDKLKLDQAFVRGIETSDQSCAIARATISMAHALNLTVTAEGVETQAQADFLVEQGCDELQGFLYAYPQDAASVAQFLEQSGTHLDRMALFNDSKIISFDTRKFMKGH